MSATTISAPQTRTWRFPRLPLADWTFITLWGWGAMLLGLVIVGMLIDHWSWIAGLFGREVADNSVTSSIWGPMSNVAVWFVGFVAGYYLFYYLPAFVANGRTRHDSAIEAGIFSGVLATLAAVLNTIGFVYERVVFAIAGWQRGTPSDLLYDSYNDYGQILLTCLIGTLMWVAGGAMIGSAFYRSNERGYVSVVVAIAAISLAGGPGGGVGATGGGVGAIGPLSFLTRQLDLPDTLLISTIVSLILTVVLAAITWWNVRSLPLRNK